MDLLLYQHFIDFTEESEFNCSKTEDVYTCQFECYGGPNIKPIVTCSGEPVPLYHKDGTNIWNIIYSPSKEQISEVEVVMCTFLFNDEGKGPFIKKFSGECY